MSKEMIISVGKCWPNPLSRYKSAKSRGSRGGKQQSVYYVIDKDGKFRRKKTSSVGAKIKKLQILKSGYGVCLDCNRRFRGRGINILRCPVCTGVLEEETIVKIKCRFCGWKGKATKGQGAWCPVCDADLLSKAKVVKIKCSCGHEGKAYKGTDVKCPECGEVFCA